jgi:hypothetical protein
MNDASPLLVSTAVSTNQTSRLAAAGVPSDFTIINPTCREHLYVTVLLLLVLTFPFVTLTQP